MTSKHRFQALKVKERRDWLIQSLRTYLLPALINRGFEVVPPETRGPVDREFLLIFPSWGRMIRARESRVDLFEIQLAPYRRAAFRINAGVAPEEGITTLTGHWPAEDVLVHWLNEFLEMYACPRWRIWFSGRRLLYRSSTQGDYDKLAIKVAGLVPELDLALREGKLGPHMRRVMIARPAPISHT